MSGNQSLEKHQAEAISIHQDGQGDTLEMREYNNEIKKHGITNDTNENKTNQPEGSEEPDKPESTQLDTGLKDSDLISTNSSLNKRKPENDTAMIQNNTEKNKIASIEKTLKPGKSNFTNRNGRKSKKSRKLSKFTTSEKSTSIPIDTDDFNPVGSEENSIQFSGVIDAQEKPPKDPLSS